MIAVDVVLLPDEAMTDSAIMLNRELVEKYGQKIVLDKQNCLPHISLAMGCVGQERIDEVGDALKKIAEESSLGNLCAVGIAVSTNTMGEKISSLEIERTEDLQFLHEQVMEKLGPYLSNEVTADMVMGPEIAETTLAWIRDYRETSSFQNFFPHITIGYGKTEGRIFPARFSASKLALCHLGNHCTCRKVLVSVDLKAE